MFRGYLRDDSLWDIEAEMRDTKPQVLDIPRVGVWQPGELIHNMTIRLTIDDALVVREIAVAMDDVPHPECPLVQAPMQMMIGCTVGPGWRQAIERNLGGIRGCAHLRELLFNMATVAFQTIPEEPTGDPVQGPPHYVGKCMTWDFNGPTVQRVHPVFFGRQTKTGAKEVKSG